MLAIYLGCLVFGGILLAASLFGASKEADGLDHDHDHDHALEHDVDADAGADLDHSHDHDHDHPAEASHGVDTAGALVASTLLSLRFWTFALAFFGLTGVLLTLIGTASSITLGLAVLMGLATGIGITSLMRFLRRSPPSTHIGTSQIQGKDAEVVLAIGPERKGKIKLVYNGQLMELPAITHGEARLERKTPVLVVAVKDGVAEVTALKPHLAEGKTVRSSS